MEQERAGGIQERLLKNPCKAHHAGLQWRKEAHLNQYQGSSTAQVEALTKTLPRCRMSFALE